MTETSAQATAPDELRAQAQKVAEQVASAIALADKGGASEDYLDAAANTLSQCLMAVDYRLGLDDAHRIVLRHVLPKLHQYRVPVRRSWVAACAGFADDEEIRALLAVAQ